MTKKLYIEVLQEAMNQPAIEGVAGEARQT
jgi:hypothetical protein